MAEMDTPLPFDPEKLAEPLVDDDYGARVGYDQNFLGVPVPMPRVADLSLVARLVDGRGHVVPYEHFSVVLHERRRLALLTASNVDSNADRKRPEPGYDYSRRGLSGLREHDHEKWVIDPRLDAEAQLPDKFYTKDRGNFDKGHIVRRDDVAWGADYAEVRRANGDTYHVTNCSPQVDAFNRSNLRGEWGELENYVLAQATSEKLCIFSGPVLDDENDRVFRGRDDQGSVEVQIPTRFWKLVVARKDDALEAFAFVLEQDLSDAEVEFNVSAEWQSKMISISDLQNLVPNLEFSRAIRDADQFVELAGARLLADAGLERYGGGASHEPADPVSSDAVVHTAGEPDVWDDTTSPDALRTAFEEGDHGKVGRLLDALRADLDDTGRLIDARAAKKVLATLRNYAWFDKLELMARTFERHAQDDVQVLRQLAQARIELGEITAAVGGLLALEEDLESRLEGELSAPERDQLETELGETMGLLGRAYKQYYVNARPSKTEPRSHDLTKSLAYYGGAFNERLGDYLWHGINYVALLTHKERIAKGRRNAISKEAARRAREILEAIENRASSEPLQPWDLANRIEANLAIGATSDAIEAMRAYLEKAGPFEVQSTRRQLVEVWMLTEDQPPGDEILPMMHARLAQLGGVPGTIELDPARASTYEKVWGTTGYRPLRWLSDALRRATSVARIGPNKYDGTGTGFLFNGAWISPDWEGEPLLLTNAHVCSNDPAVQNQYPYPSHPENLVATFLGQGGANDAVELRFAKLVWTSPPSDLDATLLLLESVPEGCVPPPRSARTPPVPEHAESRLNILGHPKGLDLRISLQDNQTVGVGERYVHYRTPTDPGSSGSPVFDQDWNLVALHHAASAARRANEGIRIDVIIEAIRQALGQVCPAAGLGTREP